MSKYDANGGISCNHNYQANYIHLYILLTQIIQCIKKLSLRLAYSKSNSKLDVYYIESSSYDALLLDFISRLVEYTINMSKNKGQCTKLFKMIYISLLSSVIYKSCTIVIYTFACIQIFAIDSYICI